MKVNAFKSKFSAKMIECLGYLITRNDIQPINNKEEAILSFKASITRKEEATTTFYWHS
jgi:hypothetical protein